MPGTSKSDMLARISTVIAIGSLLLNVVQFYTNSRAQGKKIESEIAASAPEAFYAYCNDQTLASLYKGEIGLETEPGMSAVSVRHGSEADREIRSWLSPSNLQGVNLRNKPVASFLVVGNRQDYDLHNIRALVRHAPGVADTVLLTTSLLGPKKYLFVPLDFRAPGNDSSDPDTPREVVIEYTDRYGNDLKYLTVKPTDPIDWLGDQFFRGLMRSAPQSPAANQ